MSTRHIRGNLVYKGLYEHTIAGDITAAMLVNKSLVHVNKASGAATGIALPVPGYNGQAYKIVDFKGDAATNNITITPNSGTINGASTWVISENYGAVELVWNGTNYAVSAQGTTVSATEVGFVNGVTAGTGLASKALVLDSSGNVVMPDDGAIALSRAAVAAAGANQAAATVLTDQVNAVTGSDSAKGVALPAAAVTKGPILVINTVSTASLLVYPVASGDDQINGLSANAAFELGAGEAAWFIPTSATQWYIATPHNRFNHEIVTTTNVITAAESGKTFYLNNATGFVSTLPAPALGLRFTFINSLANTSGNHTIVTNASANIFKGNQNSVAGDAGDTGTSDDTINFVANNSLAGDKVELWSDGTSWFAYAISRVAAGMTFTTAS